MLQQDEPLDLVIGTGSSLTVRDFLKHSFEAVNRDWQDYVKFDERYLRPTEVDDLQADPSMAKKAISWSHAVTPAELAHEMVKVDIENLDGFKPDKPIGVLWKEETE
jgi:GDPmannose 4,6-dehydratase